MVSLFFMIDALYDSDESAIIVIDEPELSLHPPFQERVAALVEEYAAKRQIIYATHSPYFIRWRSITNGGTIARVYLDESSATKISQPTSKTVACISSFLADRHNPHVLGLDAAAVFFIEDGVILVEGQDDVLAYKDICRQLEIDIRYRFFGWGVGGADKMPMIASLFKDLGFGKVSGILDANKAEVKARLAKEFPDYRFDVIPADDVRTKLDRRPRLLGLLDEQGMLRSEHREAVRNILEDSDSDLHREVAEKEKQLPEPVGT